MFPFRYVSVWLSLLRKSVAVGHAVGYGILVAGSPDHPAGRWILFIAAIIALLIEFSIIEFTKTKATGVEQPQFDKSAMPPSTPEGGDNPGPPTKD